MKLALRIRTALLCAPKPEDWRDFAVAAVAMAAAGAVIGSPALLHFVPRDAADSALIALRALFVPALGEELIFRAALVPGRAENKRVIAPIMISTALFTLWHAVETTFLPGSAATFLRLDFLTLAALLGLACAILRWRSNAIWTAVALHWLVVVAWQGWFGGPSFGAG
jgi:predicted Abi (CAAX) family protease